MVVFELGASEKDLGVNEWQEYIREMLRNVVLKERGECVFLLSDFQIKQEKFLEHVNNLLNIGEIPNLYPPEEKESLLEDLKEITSKQRLNLNQNQLWEWFVQKTKTKLHLVLALSPVGEKLRNRVRNFPSLVSCTSSIWVHPWTQHSLKEVATHYL
jgi:dynein heavy chain, axonemal